MECQCGLKQVREEGVTVRYNVLLVGVDVGFRDSLAEELEKNMSVCAAGHREDAIKVLQQEQIDGVVLDLEDFHGEGLALLQALRSASPQMAVVVVFPRVRSLQVVKLMRLGASNCLMKPISAHVLRQTLEGELAGPEG